jgi:hypothetical protein
VVINTTNSIARKRAPTVAVWLGQVAE